MSCEDIRVGAVGGAVLGSSGLASGAVKGTAAKSLARPSSKFCEGLSALLDFDVQSVFTCSGIPSADPPSFERSREAVHGEATLEVGNETTCAARKTQ